MHFFMRDWAIGCYCGSKFATVLGYGEHLRIHPMRCSRCKDWFYDVHEYAAHGCKQQAHDESGN